MLRKIVATLYPPRFAPDIERGFQSGYYVRVRSTLRLVSGLLAAAIAGYALLGTREKLSFVGAFNIPQLLLCLLLFVLTWFPEFGRFWQRVMVGAGWLSATLMFNALAMDLAPSGLGTVQHLQFTLQVCVFMVTVAAFRLTFLPTLALQLGVVLTGTASYTIYLVKAAERGQSLLVFFEPVLLVLLGVLLSSLVQEKLARGAFEVNRRLAGLQVQERAKRVETENMLRVLNGAIGGIVHDLGNPLTAVQTGAELTNQVLGDDQTSMDMLRDLNGTVLRGARMLSFLRVSLIEQSRAIEGKPVPIEPKPVSIRSIVDAGASFQQARFTKHTLSIESEDAQICADEMKMVTVLMNLIGNALKYSDDGVGVTWQRQENMLQIAVMDVGKYGRGITQEQATHLFMPFGRLAAHAEIEGTGLGLLSVRKIVEAHGGEVWIEGFEDGTPSSPRFCTHPDECSSLLTEPYLTAFVITCPLAL